MSQPPSPDTRIATAPAPARSIATDPDHGSIEHRSVDDPAIRAPASYRAVALAGPCGAIKTARHSRLPHFHHRPT